MQLQLLEPRTDSDKHKRMTELLNALNFQLLTETQAGLLATSHPSHMCFTFTATAAASWVQSHSIKCGTVHYDYWLARNVGQSPHTYMGKKLIEKYSVVFL
jgi:hypothetical protein